MRFVGMCQARCQQEIGVEIGIVECANGRSGLIRETPEATSAVGTFDYADLNSYLLLAAGLTHPAGSLISGSFSIPNFLTSLRGIGTPS
jgi:hypothetical protein